MNMLRALPRLVRGRRGQSLVEFAMVLPLLLIVGFIITEFGRALWIKNVLTEAAGNGARAAIVAGSDDYVQVATDAANRFLAANNMSTTQENDPSQIEVELLPPDNGTVPIRVRITREFSMIPGGGTGKQLGAGPFATGENSKVTFGSFTITGEAQMDTQPAFEF